MRFETTRLHPCRKPAGIIRALAPEAQIAVTAARPPALRLSAGLLRHGDRELVGFHKLLLQIVIDVSRQLNHILPWR